MTKSSPMGVSDASACDLVTEAVRNFGRVRLRVSGTSMVPSMRPGDMITVERGGTGEISPGEIVVFARSGRLVVHRVTAIVTAPVTANTGNLSEPLLATRGDRARREDPPVSSGELLGRVSRIERGSRLVRFRTSLSAVEQLLCRLLRISDRATSLYLRVSAL